MLTHISPHTHTQLPLSCWMQHTQRPDEGADINVRRFYGLKNYILKMLNVLTIWDDHGLRFGTTIPIMLWEWKQEV